MLPAEDSLAALLETSDFDEPTRRALAGAPRAEAPQGSTIFHPGDSCTGFVLVLAGRVRVTRLTESGRELVLYRIEPGQSCVLTTACLLAGEDHAAEAFAETDVTALIVPTALFNRLMESSSPFRAFVFQSFGSRMMRLTQLLENLAFERIDVRLARLVLSRAGESDTLKTTHQELANELGTAREVVSRHLEVFAEAGLVAISRGKLQLLDRVGLEAAAAN
jgi:CRP/FNR family transcriptional regulator